MSKIVSPEARLAAQTMAKLKSAKMSRKQLQAHGKMMAEAKKNKTSHSGTFEK